EEGKVNLNTTYSCNGAYQVAKDTLIHCSNRNGHGYQTLTQGLMNSCNPFFIHIGQMLGKDTFNKYFEAFGFTERTGVDLPNEAYPVYHPFNKMTTVDLASTSFGQSFRVSPIQMITAGCAIANGGKLMKPYIVDSIVDADGNVISKTEPTVKRQVVSEGTAATVRQMMEAVVESGTGKNAYIEGYRVAGKTATSEKLDAKGGADQLLYIASFLCFAPANDPKVAVLVGVDEPPGNYRGGGVLAAPIGKEVLEATLKYLNVEPQYTSDELKKVTRVTPSLTGETVATARARAQELKLTLRVVGDGDQVVSQVPSAGQSIGENGVIVVYTENAEVKKVEVPSFAGMTASTVKQTALSLGLNVTLTGPYNASGATAVKQSIAAGTEIQAGTTVTVQFQATANMND
ncbi:MAG: PASTA domain-containing protein, partial [Clostridia bacterium]|nr:PASTA domain-containing protein [Clostridia bacterium]